MTLQQRATEFFEALDLEVQGHSKSPLVVAVSKTKSLSSVLELAAAAPRLRAFGENYADELVEKIDAVPEDWRPKLEWHYIGRIQSRRFLPILHRVNWVHTVTREKELLILKQRPQVKFLLQVNISGEASKGGLDLDAVHDFVERIHKLGLQPQWRGWMGMAADVQDVGAAQVSRQFQRLAKFAREYPDAKELSMGMSGDWKIAVAEGSTMLRVGSLLFGERT